jgi:hypothetical protein
MVKNETQQGADHDEFPKSIGLKPFYFANRRGVVPDASSDFGKERTQNIFPIDSHEHHGNLIERPKIFRVVNVAAETKSHLCPKQGRSSNVMLQKEMKEELAKRFTFVFIAFVKEDLHRKDTGILSHFRVSFNSRNSSL